MNYSLQVKKEGLSSTIQRASNPNLFGVIKEIYDVMEGYL